MNHINGGAMKIAPASSGKNGYRMVRKTADRPYCTNKPVWHDNQRVLITPAGIAALLATDKSASGKKIGGQK